MIYLSLDPGVTHTGVAISYEGQLAQPLTTLKSADLINQIIDLTKKHQVEVIIVGEPEFGPARELAHVLRDELLHHLGGQVILHPETLTSKMATRKLVEGGIAKERRQSMQHSSAAALLLQDYLDSTLLQSR